MRLVSHRATVTALAAASISLAGASESHQPQATVSTKTRDQHQHQPPSPTPLLIDFKGVPLRARYEGDYETCGYDDNGYGLYCAWGSCVTSGDFWGCCKWWDYDVSCTATMETTCLEVDDSYYYTMEDANYDAYSTVTCSSYSYVDEYGTSIDSDLAFCATYLSSRDGSTFSSYACSSVRTAVAILEASVTTDQLGDVTNSASSTAADGSTATISAEEAAKQQPRLVGSIVGGVVGGIVVVGVSTWAAVYFWLKMFPDEASLVASEATVAEVTPQDDAAEGHQLSQPEIAHTAGANHANSGIPTRRDD